MAADEDHARYLERLNAQYATACNILADLTLELAKHLPDEEAGLNRRAAIIEQWRDLTGQSLNRAVDHALGG